MRCFPQIDPQGARRVHEQRAVDAVAGPQEDIGMRSLGIARIQRKAAQDSGFDRGDLRIGEPGPVTFHREIKVAGRAGEPLAFRFTAPEHLAGIGDAGSVQRRIESVLESVSAELAPEITAASVHAAVPIEDGIPPELRADVAGIVVPGGPVVFGAARDPARHLDTHQFRIADGRKIVVPGKLREEVHAEFAGEFLRLADLMLVAPEDDELPAKQRKSGPVFALQLVDSPDVADDAVEIAVDTILRVRRLAGAIDRAAHAAEPVLHQGFENLGPDEVQIDAVVGMQDEPCAARRRGGCPPGRD